jgi:putative hemolysin
MDLEVLFRLLLFFLLLLTSGFFAGSETALFSLGPVRLLKLEEDRRPRAGLVKQLLAEPRRLIATIFIGNELVNIAASALMASTTHHLLAGRGPLLVTAVSTGVSVTLILFIGEITPKNLAIRVVERWSCAAARPLWLLAIVMAPVRVVIERIADLVVHLLGRRVPTPRTAAVGEGEFLTMVDAVKEDGQIDESEQKLIHRVFEFGDRRVGEVMTPAGRVFALSYNLPLTRILQEVRGNIYSRVPVYHGTRDRIVGVLYAKDLIHVAYRSGPRRRLQDLLHPGYFIPKTTKCEQLFREFRRRRMHQALVVNEYGRFVGLVTMEDLLEELFGEIRDEKELPPLTDPEPSDETTTSPAADSELAHPTSDAPGPERSPTSDAGPERPPTSDGAEKNDGDAGDGGAT